MLIAPGMCSRAILDRVARVDEHELGVRFLPFPDLLGRHDQETVLNLRRGNGERKRVHHSRIAGFPFRFGATAGDHGRDERQQTGIEQSTDHHRRCLPSIATKYIQPLLDRIRLRGAWRDHREKSLPCGARPSSIAHSVPIHDSLKQIYLGRLGRQLRGDLELPVRLLPSPLIHERDREVCVRARVFGRHVGGSTEVAFGGGEIPALQGLHPELRVLLRADRMRSGNVALGDRTPRRQRVARDEPHGQGDERGDHDGARSGG